MNISRRSILTTLAAAGAATGVAPLKAATQTEAQPHAHGVSFGSHQHDGANLMVGTVDYARNDFDPHKLLTDFDQGTLITDPDGRVTREWEIVGVDKEVEVAPGIMFPAWTFAGRIPGPTLRCREGERLRIRFQNGSSHAHSMHFHGIHS